MISLSSKAFMRMGCTLLKSSKFKTEFLSGSSQLWMSCVEIKFYSGWCPFFESIGF